VQVDPAAQHLAPVHPWPPHCPQAALQLRPWASVPIDSGAADGPTSAEHAMAAREKTAGAANKNLDFITGIPSIVRLRAFGGSHCNARTVPRARVTAVAGNFKDDKPSLIAYGP
jgi:hypothetical protein